MSALGTATGRARMVSRISAAQNQKYAADLLLMSLARQMFTTHAVTKLWRRDRFQEVAILAWSNVDQGDKTRVRVQYIKWGGEFFTTAGELLTSLQLAERTP